MRTLLGRAAAATVAGIALVTGVVVVAAPAGATPSSTSTTTTTLSPAIPQAVPTTTTTTTTTTIPLVARVPNPAAVTPERGTQVQVAPTLPPPVTTTTVPVPPEWVLPANSGTGRRVVYRKTWPMRAWTVEADGRVSKTHLVSGRATWNQPTPGTYSVFSRSGYTCNITKPYICWRYMVRFTKGPDGDNIGFHEIPTNTRTGGKLQSESQLGLALSNGCVRQATPDALYIWNWAPNGTKVVVLP